MAKNYDVPFWRNQLLLGTAHPVLNLIHEYEMAERERDRRNDAGDVRLMSIGDFLQEIENVVDAGE